MKIINFINEIGNKIKIKIHKHKGVGINYKSKDKIKYNGVTIKIIGPTSMSENEITIEEAKHLYLILQNFLVDGKYI